MQKRVHVFRLTFSVVLVSRLADAVFVFIVVIVIMLTVQSRYRRPMSIPREH